MLLKFRSWIVLGLLVLHSVLLAYSGTLHSPNLNEPAHLVAGVSHWKFGRYELYRVNPPLVRMLAAIPVLMTDATFDWSESNDVLGARPVFEMGRQFVSNNGTQSIGLFTIARWACLPLSLLGGLYCYRWSREVFGTVSGIIALAIWVFSPNIIAFGQCINPDCGATSLGLISVYYFRKWIQHPGWNTALITGIVLGLAELSKTTWIILFGLYPLIWGLSFFLGRSEQPSKRQQISQLCLILAIGLYVLNLGYLFEGSLKPLKQYAFVSQILTGETKPSQNPSSVNRFSDSWFGEIPVPLPENYVLGIDVQKKDFEEFGRDSYLHGEFKPRGWWYYYLYALCVKIPLGYWGLFLLATIGATARQNGRVSALDLMTLTLPPGLILLLVSSQTGFNHHMRYVLPIFPFAFIWASSVGTWLTASSKHFLFKRCLVATLLLWAVASSLWVYPHNLSYFNEIAGGPINGHKHLLNSNIDWGQDLLHLKKWIAKHPAAQPMYLCYYGDLDPSALGLDYPLPPKNHKHDPQFTPPPGWYAVSVNYLKGYGWRHEKDTFSYFQNLQPVATGGYSIYIYHVHDAKIHQSSSQFDKTKTSP